MRKTLIIFISLSCISFNNLKAQRYADFYLYMYNYLYCNPAYAGYDSNFKIGVTNHSFDFRGIGCGSGCPPQSLTTLFGIPIKKLRSGIGIIMSDYKIGWMRYSVGSLAYNFKFRLNDKSNIRLGIGFKMEYQFVNYMWDPMDYFTNRRPELDFGIWFDRTKFYSGISISNVLTSKFDRNFYNSNSDMFIHIVAGHRIKPTQKLELLPSSQVIIGFTKINVRLNTQLIYNKMIILGAGFGHENSGSFAINMGIILFNKLDFVVATNIASNTIKLYYRPTIESNLTYKF